MAAVATTTAVAADYAALVQQIYIAYFGRPADPIGFTNYKAQLAALNAPTTLKGLLASTDAGVKALVNTFGTSPESVALYGTDTIAFVKAIFVNVLNREAAFDGLVFWAGEIDAGRLTKAAAALNIAQGAMVNTSAQGLIDAATLTNKIAAASAFTTEINTTEELTAYSGTTAASMARDMLKTVTSTTVAADFQATVVSTLAAVVVANAPVVVPPSSMTVTLTTGADASTSLAGDDTFVGTESTLSSADILNGGAGTDTLRVANSGAAKAFSGFELSNIEIVQVTADGTGATSFDVTNTTGVTKIVNHGSSQDMTFTGVKAIPTTGLSMTGVVGGNTTVTFEADAVSGSADTLKVELNGAKTIANGVIGTLTANGIETIAVTTTGAMSNLAAINSTSLKAMTVAGDKSLTLAGATFTDNVNVNTLNAGGLTGTAALNVTVLGSTATLDVAVTGGAGDDRADFSSGFDTKDAFTGGAGRDTLALTQAVASAQTSTTGGTVATVEILEVTDAGTGTISMANFSGVDTVYYAGGLGAAVTLSNAVTGITVRDNVDAVAQNVTVTLATNGTADTANFTFDKVGAADNLGTLSAAEFETVNITSNDDAAVLDVGTLAIASATLTAATKVTVAGSANTTITAVTNPATAVLGTFDASTATGKVSVAGLNLKAAGATVTLGAGNDTFNLTGTTAAGADTFDLTKGGNDTITYTTVAQSSATGTDTIKGFTTGDVVNITAAALLGGGVGGSNVAESSQFVGVKATFGEAQGALLGKASGTATQSAVFDSSTSILWIDTNGDGTLDSTDARIKFDGVTTLTAADLGLSASAGASVSLTAAAATVNTTTATLASGKSTAFNDTISSTIAFTVGSTIDGSLGTDTLVLTSAGAVGALPATITNVETLTLNTTGTTANTGVAFNVAGAFKSVNGSSNADTIASTANLIESGTISLGAGNDTITALTLFDTAAHAASTSIKFNVDMGAGDDAVTTAITTALTSDSTLAGGDGADTLTLNGALNIAAGSVTGWETIVVGANTTMTRAQYAQATTGVNGAGFAITFSDTGAVSVIAASTANTFVTHASGNAITTAQVATTTVTGGAGVDSVTFTAGWTTADQIDLAGGTTDTVTIAYDVAGAIDLTGTAGALANVEGFVISAAQAAAFTLTLDAALLTVDASAAGAATTVVATNAAMTSLKTGAGNDIITTVTANTAAQTIELGAGNDTITALNVGAGALTIDSGSGNLTITDIAVNGAGALTLKFGTPVSGTTVAANVAATTANFKAGDIFDFATAVTAIISGAANGTLGVSGGVGQVFVDTTTTAGSTIITFDADGNRTFSAGDVQITVTGNVISGGINASGNFLIA